jgi:hypothetical protein
MTAIALAAREDFSLGRFSSVARSRPCAVIVLFFHPVARSNITGNDDAQIDCGAWLTPSTARYEPLHDIRRVDVAVKRQGQRSKHRQSAHSPPAIEEILNESRPVDPL